MQLNPYLFYNGNCEEALKYYQKVLGAQIGAMFPYEGAPPDMPLPPEWKKKLMHASITIDGEVLMASDATPGDYHPPQGFAVSLQVEDPADADVTPAPRPGDKVVVKLGEWRRRDHPLIGTIVSRLGRTHEPRAELAGIYLRYDLSTQFPAEVEQEAAALLLHVQVSVDERLRA